MNSADLVYAPTLLSYLGTSYGATGLDGGGFITIANLLTLARNASARYSTATAGSAAGNYLVAIAQALQAANLDTSFVQQTVPSGI